MDASALRKYGSFALIIVLAALMTALAVQNRQLRQEQALLVSKVEQISKAAHGLPEGAQPEALGTTALDGQAVTLAGPASGRQVLYFCHIGQLGEQSLAQNVVDLVAGQVHWGDGLFLAAQLFAGIK